MKKLWRRLAGLGLFLLWPAMASASTGGPAGSGVIISAVRWLEGTLLGTIATVVAVIAVASVGLLMLTGRIIQPAQITPTLKVRQGTSISIFVARDLDFTGAESRR